MADPLNLVTLLQSMIDHKASALHLTAGAPPWLELDGELIPLKLPPLADPETRQLLAGVLTAQQATALQAEGQGMQHFAFSVKGVSRFDCCAFTQRGALAATFRTIPFALPAAPAWLEPTRRWLQDPGLLCVAAGPPGSGRSGVLAQWVDHVNTTQKRIILTLEAPIGFLHPHKNSAVNQVELGSDVGASHALALARGSGASYVLVDLDDALGLATNVLRGGVTVLASLTAHRIEVARAMLEERIRPFEREAVRMVWLEAPGVGRIA